MQITEKDVKTNGFQKGPEKFLLGPEGDIQYINIKLAALGQPVYGDEASSHFLNIAHPLLRNHQEKNRLLRNYYCPVDYRVQTFLNNYLKGVIEAEKIRLPVDTFILDRPGQARTLSLPPNKDSFISDIVSSYRVKQGVLHNPKHDRRTTAGAFHIAEGGFPIPYDKSAVPKHVFARLLHHAVNPPPDLLQLPFTSAQKNHAELFVSLLMRPSVMPEAGSLFKEKSMEIRFFTPGNLVSNLDFVESIFGNAGDPYLPENDAELDVEHWTGHSGCVLLAPHLIHLKKKDLGLPSYKKATPRQKRDGMCWKSPGEKYNGGSAFKVSARDQNGVMVTLIADNYFGYSKKEVKTQISYAANLFGMAEEEHSGGAIAFQSYDLGDEFHLDETLPQNGKIFKEVVKDYGDMMAVKKAGYAVDKKYPDIFYVPEDARFDLRRQTISWRQKNREKRIKLLAYHTYILPSGYRIQMQKQVGGHDWRLNGTVGEGTLCHKPCTVSGGGKSEISKSIADTMIQGPVFVADFKNDFNQIEKIICKDYRDRFRKKYRRKRSRPILSPKRSLGSVIKLFTPSIDYTDSYNKWLESLPHHIRELVFIIKRHYKDSWGNDWRKYFSVDTINGHPGHELKYGDYKLWNNYLRVGRETDGSWRIYKVRQDYNPSEKVQVEDDITASVVVPRTALGHLNPDQTNPSVKLVLNCERMLFQRPDDAIYRGYDKQAEYDLSSPNTFLSNYEPLTLNDAKELIKDAVEFDHYTQPVKELIHGFADNPETAYFASSSHPRMINGKRSKNPRYLQNRPDLVNHRSKYLAEVGTRLSRWVPLKEKVHFPVNSVLAGRRMSPADPKLGIPSLAVYNPIHYQELPELFIDFICSVTGKSPSTTGFGSEGALTKGPFNALWPIVDLNNAIVSYILTGYDGFTSAAGFIGPKYKVDHDISLLIPEVWCRMQINERDPKSLIKNGYLEKLEDFKHKGKNVPASLLGYRITLKFVHSFFGRVFNSPNAVFTPEMLAPEKQDLNAFVEGIHSLVHTQKRVAEYYFADKSIEAALPPLKALLTIMTKGHYHGKKLTHPDVRSLFTRSNLLKSSWYHLRLKTKQGRDMDLWSRHGASLDKFIAEESHALTIEQLGLRKNRTLAHEMLKWVKSSSYLQTLRGTIGSDPFEHQIPSPR